MIEKILIGIVVAVIVGIVKLVLWRIKPPLTTCAKEILRAAPEDGLILIIPPRDWVLGQWVRCGNHDFIKQGDPSYQAKYLDALSSLVHRGFARQEGQEGNAYRLTGLGFDKRKSLASVSPRNWCFCRLMEFSRRAQ